MIILCGEPLGTIRHCNDNTHAYIEYRIIQSQSHITVWC